ncbi:MAG: homocysteine S-methyltransferase family protein [Eubacterium ventriosum]
MVKPEWIIDIHKSYVQAGAQIVYANTFGANRYKMESTGYTCQLIGVRHRQCKKPQREQIPLWHLICGPIGQLLEPTGSLTLRKL